MLRNLIVKTYSHRKVKYDAELQMNLMNGFLIV